jgi:hypothetical protein
MLQEGYRWGGHYAAWHFWIGEEHARNQYGSNPWRAVFVRQYDWTFGSGQKVNRTFGIFNDTQYPEPISFTRTLTIGGKQVSTKSSTHSVAPGTNFKFDETLTMPTVATRQEGELVLTLSARARKFSATRKAFLFFPKPSLGAATSAPAAKPRQAVASPQQRGSDAANALSCAETACGKDPQVRLAQSCAACCL